MQDRLGTYGSYSKSAKELALDKREKVNYYISRERQNALFIRNQFIL